MRTQEDLRTVLAAREELAPPVDEVLAGATVVAAGYRRRRATTAGAVAAAVVAVAAVITVPVLLTDPESEPAATDPAARPPAEVPAELLRLVPFDPAEPRPPYSFTIYPGSVAGYEIRPVSLSPEVQLANLLLAGQSEPVATLIVYQPDTRIQVGAGGEVLLRWEYTPGGFAEIQGDPDSAPPEGTLQRVADRLRFTQPYPARLPYRLDYLPAGQRPFNVVQDSVRSGEFRSSVQLEPLNLDISIADGGADLDNPDWDWRPTTIAGRPAQCADLVDGRRCTVELDEFTVSLGVGNLEPAELDRLIAGLHPATWDDPTTWYELDEALPGGDGY